MVSMKCGKLRTYIKQDGLSSCTTASTEFQFIQYILKMGTGLYVIFLVIWEQYIKIYIDYHLSERQEHTSKTILTI